MAMSPEPDARNESATYTTSLFLSAEGGRVYTDGAGELWSVFEVNADGVPGARGRKHCLIFVAERTVRRVWDYPDNWFLLDDEDLAAVSWGR